MDRLSLVSLTILHKRSLVEKNVCEKSRAVYALVEKGLQQSIKQKFSIIFACLSHSLFVIYIAHIWTDCP